MICEELTINGEPYFFLSDDDLSVLLIDEDCPLNCDCDACGGRPAGCEYVCD